MDLTTALSPEHYEEIVLDSCINPDVATARGYRTLTGTGADRDELESLGFARHQIRDESFPLLLIPMHGMDGTVRGHQIKPAAPRERVKEDGTRVPIKYETPAKAPIVVDVPAFTRDALKESPTTPLWVTEGMKKTDSLVSKELACVGLTGVFNWRNKHGVLGDWEEVPIKDRPVVLCFDADAMSNRNVQLAMSRAGAWFRSRGASTVHYLVTPALVGETPTKGIDDYFAAGGEVDALRDAATTTAPGAGEKGAEFTDAFLVEELAEAMAGRFCWASGLGWLRWTGRVWKEVSDVEPLEAVRIWAGEQFDKALAEQRKDVARNLSGQIAGWRAILGKARLTALRDLARGLLQRDAAEFDGDPDLLTVLNGTIHLPTGKLLAFDPEHCITKSADADYRRGYTHPMWTAALQAIPVEMHIWYQDRLGQALTGYPTPDHTLVIGCGTGSNGKSTIADIIRKTMGGYGVLVSDRVLMANPDAHPTELMDLRGARYAVMEETPEARHLNVQRLKTTIGTPVIRARHIRQDTVEFLTSHSLFINTNYRPTVTETDWGTWRRLALMTFPFTFKRPGAALEGPWDRSGDPTLAYASNDPDVRAAALAWMAAGARAWYARGRMMLGHPGRVERDTREWRSETDLILGFADERLVFETEAFTQTREMLAAFNEWAGERGHRPWNDRTFATRFGDHDTVRAAKVKQGRFSIGGKQQRGWGGVKIRKGDDPWGNEEPEFPRTPTPEEDAAFRELVNEPEPARLTVGHNGINSVVNGRAEWKPPAQGGPTSVGFDLETCSVKQLFTGGHEGPFVRLAGVAYSDGIRDTGIESAATYPPAPFRTTLEILNGADENVGANTVLFDHLALAYHHGADYEELTRKAVDLRVREYLVDPPLSKGMPNGYYGLDAMAERYGVAGKTDDIKALARKHGGYDRIPLDDPDYNAYLRGDLASLMAIKEAQDRRLEAMGLIEYELREREIVSLQGQMTLNGWNVDTRLLEERIEQEADQRAGAIAILGAEYGVPLNAPDVYRLKVKSEWPENLRSIAVTDARVMLRDRPDECVATGIATQTPGEPHKSPWSTKEGRPALKEAFHAAGAEYVPLTKDGHMALAKEALGDKPWYDKNQRAAVPGLLQMYDTPELRTLVEVVLQATGARVKYAEVAKYLTDRGRVHGMIGGSDGDVQGSGRWSQSPFTTMGKRSAAAARERDVVIADPGHVLITADLSQCDVRTMAALSQDTELIAMLQPGMDFHAEMAEVYCGDRTKRDDYKPVSHGTNYGMQAKAIAEQYGLPIAMVQAALDARAGKFWRLVEFTEEVRERASRGELLDNGFGRLMRCTPERAFTQAPALMGQGATRDVMCESLLRLARKRPDVRPYLRAVVHDELVLSVPADTVEEWAGELREAMTWEWRGVPILCDVSKPAFRWSDCK